MDAGLREEGLEVFEESSRLAPGLAPPYFRMAELYELMELANKGLVKLSMKEYKLDDANKALHDLNEGKVKGRAVLVP